MQLYAFDVLALDGDDLRQLPLHLQKNHLAGCWRGGSNQGIFSSPFQQGEIGPDLFRHAAIWPRGIGFETPRDAAPGDAPVQEAFARKGPPAGLGAMEPTTPADPNSSCMEIAADRSQRSTARAVRLGDAFRERLRPIASDLAPKFYPVLVPSWLFDWPGWAVVATGAGAEPST